MQVGLALPQLDRTGTPLPWAEVVAWARRAEDLGFASIWVGDHAPPSSREPVVMLAALARHTHRVRLGTLALSRLRNPAVLAKELATLDVISQGRLVVGLGPPPDQASAAGSGDDGDIECLAETLQVLRGMFGGGPFSFQGSTVEVVEAPCLPRPVQVPGPALLVTGASQRLVDIAGAHADGWISAGTTTVEGWRMWSDRLDHACAQAGRDPHTVSRSVFLEGPWGTVDQTIEKLHGWESAGVSTVVLGPGETLFSPASGADVELLATACNLLSP